MIINQYSLSEAAAVIGESYSRCWHIYAYKKLPPPRRLGRTFVLSDDDLSALKAFFQDERDEDERQSHLTRGK